MPDKMRQPAAKVESHFAAAHPFAVDVIYTSTPCGASFTRHWKQIGCKKQRKDNRPVYQMSPPSPVIPK